MRRQTSRCPLHRRRGRQRRCFVVSCLLSAALFGCSGARERALLEQFFSASRLRDLTALRGVASVVFEPREQGTVLSFEIQSIEEVSAGSKIVRVDAEVRRPDGQTVREILLVTISGRIVTGVVEVPSTPRS